MLHIISTNDHHLFKQALKVINSDDAVVILGSIVTNSKILSEANEQIKTCYVVSDEVLWKKPNSKNSTYSSIEEIDFRKFLALSIDHIQAFTWY